MFSFSEYLNIVSSTLNEFVEEFVLGVDFSHVKAYAGGTSIMMHYFLCLLESV